jgi:hypothetical protein
MRVAAFASVVIGAVWLAPRRAAPREDIPTSRSTGRTPRGRRPEPAVRPRPPEPTLGRRS